MESHEYRELITEIQRGKKVELRRHEAAKSPERRSVRHEIGETIEIKETLG
jgi:hypothetical protein